MSGGMRALLWVLWTPCVVGVVVVVVVVDLLMLVLQAMMDRGAAPGATVVCRRVTDRTRGAVWIATVGGMQRR